MSAGRLIICPTPIGNLEDVTLRVLATLREADIVACEDTRRTRTLLHRYGVTGTLVSYHEHNERERAAELIQRMRAGVVVALVSDAGMPLVSDPGFILVEACIAAGLYGIDHELELPAAYAGNAYDATDVPRIPSTLAEAIGELRDSEIAAEAFGPDVHHHLLNTAQQEWEASNRHVSDWELARNFERM